MSRFDYPQNPQETVSSLKERVFSLREENELLKSEIEEARAERRKSGDEILRKQLEADKRLKEADYVYLTALKEAKYFSDGFKKASSNGTEDEKRAIIDLLSDLFGNLKPSSAKEKVKNGLELLPSDEKKASCEDEPFEFDLEEAINPKGELSLEELCKELGVYNG